MGSIRDIIDTGKEYITSCASSIINHSNFKDEISRASFNGQDATEIEIDNIIREEVGTLTESQFKVVMKEMSRILSKDNVSINDYEYAVVYCQVERVSDVKIELEW